MEQLPGVKSKWYPYYKVESADFDFSQFAKIPRLICDYLIDAPNPIAGYEPMDDNSYPRARFWKYLLYDGERPLDNLLPTIQEKMSVIFNPANPTEPPTDKGYRLIPQQYIKQAQTDAQTRVYVYMGRTQSTQNNFAYNASVVFDVLTNYTYNANTKSDEYSRTGAIVAAIVEALNGVNITGVGTFSMLRSVCSECGTRPIYDGENIGIQLIMALELATIENNGIDDTDNMRKIGNDLKLW